MRPPLLMAGETLLSCWKKQIGVIMSHLFVYNFKTMYIGIICQSRERSDPYDLVVCFVHIIMRLIKVVYFQKTRLFWPTFLNFARLLKFVDSSKQPLRTISLEKFKKVRPKRQKI